jgi:hypothetical protein
MAMLGAECNACCDKCENRSCTTLGGVVQGECEDKPGCCCEVDPEGSCFDPSVLDENNELTVPIIEAPLRGYCFTCCANEVIFSMLASFIQPEDPNDRPRSEAAGEWVEGVRAWMEANGYTNVSSYNVFCSKGGSSEEETNNVVWVRGCCDGTYSEDAADCYDVYDSEPADSFGLTPQVNLPGGGNPCSSPGSPGAGPWIPLCVPNPLP